jgi:putative endonuclease
VSVERQKARARGTAAEWVATAYLAAKGYRILSRQFLARGGELDVVALTPFWTQRTLVFIEVRARGTVEAAAESVGATKRQRVEAAAAQFRARKPKLNKLPHRFDLVLLAPGRWPHHIVDAWRV